MLFGRGGCAIFRAPCLDAARKPAKFHGMTEQISPESTMEELLAALPGAQRALFRNYHVGGCSSCGFRPEETLAGVCARNGGLDPIEVLDVIRRESEEEEKRQLPPEELKSALAEERVRLVDIRSREEFEAVHIEGALPFNQQLMQTMMAEWPKDAEVVVMDHRGERAPDAAAYLAGHGFANVRVLRGGIDAWSVEVDPSLPRYTLE